MRSRFNRVYYGWIMVAVLTAASFTQVGEFNPVLAVFMKPFGDDFGWSRAEVSLATSLGSFGGGLIGPFTGWLIDRYGSRAILVTCQVIYGTCLLSLTFLNGSLFHFLLAFSLGRMVVQGGTALATQVAISNWFIRLRGQAMGVSTLGTRIGQAILPAAIALITQAVGWRYAWLFLGGIVWVLGIIPSSIFIRRRPEDLGYLPDGGRLQDAIPRQSDPLSEEASARVGSGTLSAAQASALEPSWTLREALRTRSLWLLTFASALSFFFGAGINLHLYPYLTDAGLAVPEAVFAMSVYFAVAGAGAVVWGVILDRFPLRFCMAIGFLASGAGIVVLIFTNSLLMALVFGVFYGLSFGGLHTMTQVMWADYYGRANVGTIAGALLPIQLITNAMGPLFGGWMYDIHGTYSTAFAVYALFGFLACVWALAAGAPQLRPTTKAPVTAR